MTVTDDLRNIDQRDVLAGRLFTGIVGVDDTGADAQVGRYRLEPAAAEVLTDTDSLSYAIEALPIDNDPVRRWYRMHP